mmetsp:Transcript_13493/g.19353  ORF Transcript_13493/g.19353 Transcript_13493/m.19353 type:complete len:88 (+) Transcript_13493:205-468(+)
MSPAKKTDSNSTPKKGVQLKFKSNKEKKRKENERFVVSPPATFDGWKITPPAAYRRIRSKVEEGNAMVDEDEEGVVLSLSSGRSDNV